MGAKGVDTGDKVLAKAIASRLIHVSPAMPARAYQRYGETFGRAGLGFANVT
jgi:hypothetical protein